MGTILKNSSDSTEYLLDSFPVPICDNIRIFNVKIVHSAQYRGYIASKKRYFYGVRVQLLTTKNGIPVEFVFMPGSASDVRALNAKPSESTTWQ
ncbi:transposase [Nostoc sp. JL31]|uniref:transposase n=1 Tax=Nostoc sp. JL31 TaxID=2815395 RepID=UPI0025E930A9|nr:transposase [Nostoc sp. JL31]